MALAHIVQEEQQPAAAVYKPDAFEELDRQLDVLAAVARDKLKKQVCSLILNLMALR